MRKLVIVTHPEITGCSVPVVIKRFEVEFGDDSEEREISRAYTFDNYTAHIPFQYVDELKKQREDNDFKVVGIVPIPTNNMSESELEEYEKFKRDVAKYIKRQEKKNAPIDKEACPFCDKEYDGDRAWPSIVTHVRSAHEKEYEKWKAEEDEKRK